MMPRILPSFVTHQVTGIQSAQIYKALARQRNTMPDGPTARLLDDLIAMVSDDCREAFHRELEAMDAAASRGGAALDLLMGRDEDELRADFIRELEERDAA